MSAFSNLWRPRHKAIEAKDVLAELLTLHRGHFRYESGHHGSLWLDLESLFAHPARLTPLIRDLSGRLARHRPDAVCGPSSGGAILAYAIAESLGVSFYPAERHANAERVAYQLPPSVRSGLAGQRVAIVDDAMNAGFAVRATLADLRGLEARCVTLGTLLTLGRMPGAFADEAGLPLETLAHIDNDIWPPEDCPLCRSGKPLTRNGEGRPGGTGGLSHVIVSVRDGSGSGRSRNARAAPATG